MAKITLSDNTQEPISGEFLPLVLTLEGCKDLCGVRFVSLDGASKKERKNSDDLVLKISKNGNAMVATTSNYVGKIYLGQNEISIRSRFFGVLLKRMLHYANDVFLDGADLKIGSPAKAIFLNSFFTIFLRKA